MKIKKIYKILLILITFFIVLIPVGCEKNNVKDEGPDDDVILALIDDKKIAVRDTKPYFREIKYSKTEKNFYDRFNAPHYLIKYKIDEENMDYETRLKLYATESVIFTDLIFKHAKDYDIDINDYKYDENKKSRYSRNYKESFNDFHTINFDYFNFGCYDSEEQYTNLEISHDIFDKILKKDNMYDKILEDNEKSKEEALPGTVENHKLEVEVYTIYFKKWIKEDNIEIDIDKIKKLNFYDKDLTSPGQKEILDK